MRYEIFTLCFLWPVFAYSSCIKSGYPASGLTLIFLPPIVHGDLPKLCTFFVQISICVCDLLLSVDNLFSDAKIREDFAQKVVASKSTGNLAHSGLGLPKVLG